MLSTKSDCSLNSDYRLNFTVLRMPYAVHCICMLYTVYVQHVLFMLYRISSNTVSVSTVSHYRQILSSAVNCIKTQLRCDSVAELDLKRQNKRELSLNNLMLTLISLYLIRFKCFLAYIHLFVDHNLTIILLGSFEFLPKSSSADFCGDTRGAGERLVVR